MTASTIWKIKNARHPRGGSISTRRQRWQSATFGAIGSVDVFLFDDSPVEPIRGRLRQLSP